MLQLVFVDVLNGKGSYEGTLYIKMNCCSTFDVYTKLNTALRGIVVMVWPYKSPLGGPRVNSLPNWKLSLLHYHIFIIGKCQSGFWENKMNEQVNSDGSCQV